MRWHGFFGLVFFLSLAAPAQAEPADVAAAVAAPGRPEAALELDQLRKPEQLLTWLGLERGDRVLDWFTGSGYYAEILARAVGPEGSVDGWNPPAFGRSERIQSELASLRQRNPNVEFHSSPTTKLKFEPETYDFVMLHLVYHDAYWESEQYELPRIDPATVTSALFQATKPGGIVAVIDHVSAAGRDTRAEVEATHRIDPAVVRGDFERAGFVFDGESDLLRNPDDDLSINVFDPSIRGRTDRFVYRFRKPS